MPNTPKIPAWLVPALVATLALSIACAGYRLRAESRSKAVAILVEAATVDELAQGRAGGWPAVLGRLQSAGLTGVVLPEQTIGDLIDDGRIAAESGTLSALDATAAQQLHYAVEARIGKGAAPQDGRRSLERVVLPGAMRLGFVRGLSAGPNPDQAKAIAATGLTLAVRLKNEPSAGPEYFRSAIARSAELGGRAIIPIGDQAPGHRELIKDVADQIAVMGLDYASPEFAKIAGDAQLAARLKERLLRLHAVQAAEIDRMSRGEVVDRFARAYRERNIRLLLVRPVGGASPDPVEDLASAIRDIRSAVEREGGTVKWPTPIQDPGVPSSLAAALAAAVALVAGGIAWALLPAGAWRWIGVLVAAALGAAAIWGPGRVYLATAAAFAFPLGGYLLLESRARIQPWRELGWMCLFSLAGGLAVAGLLSELAFMVRVDQFFAVKLAHFGPIVAAGAWMASRRFDFSALWRTPVLWGLALTLLAVLAALAFMLARTGNDNPATVSGFELKFRALLDTVLTVRPRTKEFLIGHPAAILGLLALARARAAGAPEGWAIGLLTLGAIGQTSIVNTLCHIHSPLDLNLMRIAIGLVLGGILGLVLWKLPPFRVATPQR